MSYSEGDSVTLTMETMGSCKHHPDTKCPMGRISGMACLLTAEQHETILPGSTWKCRVLKVGVKEETVSYLIVKAEEQIRSSPGDLPRLSSLLSEAVLKGIEQMAQERDEKIEKNKKSLLVLYEAQRELQNKLNEIETKISTMVDAINEDTVQLRTLEEAKKKYEILSTPDCDSDTNADTASELEVELNPESTQDIQSEIASFNNTYK